MDKNRKPYPQKGIERIKAAKLIEKLQKHVFGELKMTSTQIRAAEILIKRVLPEVRSIEMVADIKQTQSVINAQPDVTAEEWQKKHTGSSGDHSQGRKPH